MGNKKENKKEKENTSDVDSRLDKSGIASGRIIGRKISQYTILAFLGQGAMASVYKARDTTGAEVALKLLIEGPAIDNKAINRFKREALASKVLRRHPNIITVYETGEEGGVHYIAMECVGDGRTLNDVLSHRKLPVEEAVDIAIHIAGALEYAHKEGIIHRDIKPGNIMTNEFGQAILTDFGLVKSMDTVVATYTATGAVMGTPIYMCPEQTRSEKTTVQYDIYSLGIVLYEMLARRPPFHVEEGETMPDLFHKIRDVRMPSPRKFNERIPKRLEAIVLKATEKSPKDRYRKMSDFVQDLRHFQEGKVVMARKPTFFEYFERNLKRHSLRASLAVMIFAAVAGLVYFFRGELREQRLQFLLNKARRMSLDKRSVKSEPGPLRSETQLFSSIIPESVLLKPGDEFFKNDEYQRALEIYQDIANHYDKEEIASVARYKMGLCSYKLDKIEEAIEIFSRVREDSQGSDLAKLATLEIAMCLLRGNNLEDAGRVVRIIGKTQSPIEVKEKLVDFYQELGNAYRVRKSQRKAEEAYMDSIGIAESISMDRFSASGRLYLARIFAEEGRNAEAVLEFEKILELYPKQRWFAAWALLDLGHMYLKQGQAKEATERYEKLSSEYEDQIWPSSLAGLMLGQTDPREFLQEISTFHEEFWNDAYYVLGLRFIVDRKYERAEKLFQQSLKVSEDDEWPAAITRQQLKALQERQ